VPGIIRLSLLVGTPSLLIPACASSSVVSSLPSEQPIPRTRLHWTATPPSIRALNFLYKTASDDAAFSRFGEDLLWAFYTISHTAADHELSESARTMGRELAARWRKSHRHVPPDASPNRIFLGVWRLRRGPPRLPGTAGTDMDLQT
jgi:hypothetical protein